MSCVSCESTIRVFYSRFYSRFQVSLNLAPSQCWDQKTLDRQKDSSLHQTLSSSIPLSLGGISKTKVESPDQAFPGARLPQALSEITSVP